MNQSLEDLFADARADAAQQRPDVPAPGVQTHRVVRIDPRRANTTRMMQQGFAAQATQQPSASPVPTIQAPGQGMGMSRDGWSW